jgi:enoyl-CoA hydratase/carnithine racemase
MEHVQSRLEDGVLSLILARPEKKNALTNAMYGALADGLAQAGADPAVRCVLITSQGDAFTSGNDLGDFAAVASGAIAREDMHVHRFLGQLSVLDKPIVAAVPGLAVGVGTTMLLHCDLVFLADTATLSAPFVDLALVPEAASSALLPARIGHVRAFAMFALGERLDAQTALSLGLANRVVAGSELQAVARAACAALSAKPLGALIATKRLMRERDAITARMAIESDVFQDRLKSPEAREAFTAFAERRKPDFSRV